VIAGFCAWFAQDFVESLQRREQRSFDLLILGHSIPLKDKQQLVEASRTVAILALLLAFWPGNRACALQKD
jgi:hypothetical protein